jgi:hypothetical protein
MNLARGITIRMHLQPRILEPDFLEGSAFPANSRALRRTRTTDCSETVRRPLYVHF